MADYSNIESNEYSEINQNGLQVPKVWALQNRSGYRGDAMIVNNTRKTNLMINGASTPKSYATLTGGLKALHPSQSYGSANEQAKKSFETTMSPDYMSFGSEYDSPPQNVAAYYANSPSGNLMSVANKVNSMMMAKK